MLEKQPGDCFPCLWVAGEWLARGGALQRKRENSFLHFLEGNITGQGVWIGSLKGEKRV